jgi:hypothetical protein
MDDYLKAGMITGKPGSHKRALRRHHDKRKKAWVCSIQERRATLNLDEFIS